MHLTYLTRSLRVAYAISVLNNRPNNQLSRSFNFLNFVYFRLGSNKPPSYTIKNYIIIFFIKSLLRKVILYIRFNLLSDLVPLIGTHRLMPMGKAHITLRKPIF